MKFKLFGSGKEKEKKKSPKSNAAATQIAELEEQLNDWTDNLKETEQRLQKRSAKDSDSAEVIPLRPHGPINELSLEEESALDEDDSLNEALDDIKLVEVQGEGDSLSEEKDEKSDSAGDSLKQLFTNNEDEDNPLVNLIQSLPEVTINELEEDLKEIKDIIKDWQRK
ncbi:MAG: hypothetical protein ABR954_03805 [Dehalococcoidales bacterium]